MFMAFLPVTKNSSVPPDEETLVALAKTGATRPFENLVRLHQNALRRFLIRFLKDDALADDVAQDSFVTAWQNISKLKNGAKFKSWLFSIAYRKAIDKIREQNRRFKRDDDFYQTQNHAFENNDQTIAKMTFEKIMSGFDDKTRSVLELFYGSGFTHEEISKISDIPLGSVKSLILRNKEKLLNSFSKEEIS